MKNKIQIAGEAFDSGDIEKTKQLVKELLANNPSNIDALILKARIFYKQQKWSDALNTLNKALEINPNNSEAAYYQQMINEILTFWNKNNYNP